MLLPVPGPQLPLPPHLCFQADPAAQQALAAPGVLQPQQVVQPPQPQRVDSFVPLMPERDSFVPHPKHQGQPLRDSFVNDEMWMRDSFAERVPQRVDSFVPPPPSKLLAPAPRYPVQVPAPRIASMDVPLPPPPPPQQPAASGPGGLPLQVVEQPTQRTTPPPPAPPSARSFDFPVRPRVSSSAPGYPQSQKQSFAVSEAGSVGDGLEQWRPPPSVASFQLRTEAALAGPGMRGPSAPNATYHGPQPIPSAQPQCPVQ